MTTILDDGRRIYQGFYGLPSFPLVSLAGSQQNVCCSLLSGVLDSARALIARLLCLALIFLVISLGLDWAHFLWLSLSLP